MGVCSPLGMVNHAGWFLPHLSDDLMAPMRYVLLNNKARLWGSSEQEAVNLPKAHCTKQ